MKTCCASCGDRSLAFDPGPTGVDICVCVCVLSSRFLDSSVELSDYPRAPGGSGAGGTLHTGVLYAGTAILGVHCVATRSDDKKSE